MIDKGENIDQEQMDRHSLHSSIIKWLVHRMPGQSRQKLPGIVYNEIDNQSCWALVRIHLHSFVVSMFE
jgi:hypothetical protein